MVTEKQKYVGVILKKNTHKNWLSLITIESSGITQDTLKYK